MNTVVVPFEQRSNVAEFKTRISRLSTGERLPLLIGTDGLPVPLPNQWALLIRRPQVQVNTVIAELEVIGHVYDWAFRRNVDLSRRLLTGHGLSPDELTSLYENLRFKRDLGRRLAKRQFLKTDEPSVVVGRVHAARVATARSFLTWALERILYQLPLGDPRIVDLRERRARIDKLSRAFTSGTSDRNPPRLGLSKVEQGALLAAIDPTSAHNPFQKRLRLRNLVAILLMLVFGYRRAEILKLYVSDINTKGRTPTVRLLRRPGDPNDHRIIEPAVKTLGRELPLSKEMSRLLDGFIQYHRPLFTGSDESPFLLFSTRGRPLSLRMVNGITEQICRHVPSLQGRLTPHILRHTSNDMINEAAEMLGISGEHFSQARNYLYGWQPDSEQGNEYSQRAIRDRANRLSMAHQESLFS